MVNDKNDLIPLKRHIELTTCGVFRTHSSPWITTVHEIENERT
jgi:hypothetical protein